MEVFSIVCLVVILFVIQHLLNWFWRKNYKEDGLLVIGIVLTLYSIVLSGAIIHQIIIWGKSLV